MVFKVINNFHEPHSEFLSNFYPVTIIGASGIVYPSAEHAYQAAKSLDNNVRKQIAALKTPGQAKKAGRKINPIRPNWEDVKLKVMASILRDKFSDPVLKEKLLATGDAILVEGNTWGDTFWGAIIKDNAEIGANHLGRLLMFTRRKLREE